MTMRHLHYTCLLLLSACTPKTLGSLPDETTADTTGTTTEDPSAGTTSSPDPITTGSAATDANDTTMTTSTTGLAESTSDTDATDDSTTAPPAHHPGCDLPFPTPTPDLPDINSNADGTPKFNDWAALSCDSVDTNHTCNVETDCGQSKCLQPADGEPGVCTESDIDIWCDGEGEAIGYGDHTCWICAFPEYHAFACCTAIPTFDCRVWPFPADGPSGSVCARHDDCEPGLVCGPHKGAGYGICQCPGLAPASVVPPDSCF